LKVKCKLGLPLGVNPIHEHFTANSRNAGILADRYKQPQVLIIVVIIVIIVIVIVIVVFFV